jgi:glyoxylase-like metal-dependent hydrolase (beta-lactamase superfamily II)/predicted ester cyclase
MATTSEVARAYFDALAAHDLDAAVALWTPGSLDRMVGDQDLVAPEGIRRYFSELFDAFPDFAFEILELTSGRGRVAVRWKATATFAGPGHYLGFAPNHARVAIEGCDVVTVADDKIVHNDAYFDSGDVARQLGLLPANRSVAQQRLAAVANVRTRAARAVRAGEPEPVADGVWVIRGGFPLRTMNVYLIEGSSGVVVFDAGIDGMQGAIAAAGARMGGIERIVLGHADADHRGGAAGLGADIHCHPLERDAAQSPDSRRAYMDLGKLRPYARPFYARMLEVWDGGALSVAATVAEGDDVAGFTVVELPGHAPGLIGLWRESDRLVLCSDCVYTLDIQTSRKGPPRVPHPAFDCDVEQARASVRKLAELGPATVWAGHTDPVVGDVAGQLRAAAQAPLP